MELRKEKLCTGGFYCSKSRNIEKRVTCNSCFAVGRVFERHSFTCIGCNQPTNPKKKCPKCGIINFNQQTWSECSECKSRDIVFENCSDCPITRLAAQWTSETGALLRAIAGLESSIQRYRFSPDEITRKEDFLIRILEEERAKFRMESIQATR